MASIVLFHVDDTAFGKCLRHARGETVYSLQGSRSFSPSLSFFLRRARARARIPLRPLRPPRRPHREGVAWLARQPALAHRNLSSFLGLIRCRRENDNRFIHMRATGRVSPVRFLKPSLGSDRSPFLAKNSTFVESSRCSSSLCVFQVLTFFPPE